MASNSQTEKGKEEKVTPVQEDEKSEPEQSGNDTHAKSLENAEPATNVESAENKEKPESTKREQEPVRPKKKKTFWKRNKFWINFLIKIAVSVGIMWALLTYVFGIYFVRGNNMYPAVLDGDLCITYKLDPYNTKDVVFYEINGTTKAGRIVARGGEEYNITPEGPEINGSISSENIFYPTEINPDSDIQFPYNVDEKNLFILNDMRTDMTDSRAFGQVREDDVKGKVVFIFRVRGF